MQTIEASRTQRNGVLWFGVLAGPVGWAVQLTADYLTDEWLSCTKGFQRPGVIFGLPSTTWIILTNAFFVVLLLAAFAASYQAFRRYRVSDPTTGKRAGFMAFMGMANSIVFLFPIVMAFVPALTLRRCMPTP